MPLVPGLKIITFCSSHCQCQLKQHVPMIKCDEGHLSLNVTLFKCLLGAFKIAVYYW